MDTQSVCNWKTARKQNWNEHIFSSSTHFCHPSNLTRDSTAFHLCTHSKMFLFLKCYILRRRLERDVSIHFHMSNTCLGSWEMQLRDMFFPDSRMRIFQYYCKNMYKYDLMFVVDEGRYGLNHLRTTSVSLKFFKQSTTINCANRLKPENTAPSSSSSGRYRSKMFRSTDLQL